MPSAAPTLRTLARDLGLSRTTVSDALRGSARVDPRTAERVRRAAEAAGYRRNPLAGALMSELRRSRGGEFRGVLAAGVSGHLNLLDVEVPTSASIDQAIHISTGRTLDWALESDVEVTTLSGSISLWAEVLWARYSRRIANWSGDHDVFGLFSDDGRVCLGDLCLGM